MNKEFAPYEQALDLKELGFDEPCMFTYTNNLIQYCPHHLSNTNLELFKENSTSIPTFSQAFRWFREKYKINIEIQYHIDRLFHPRIYDMTNMKFRTISLKGYKTYEKAELGCLKKLIKIVKNNK